MGRAVTRENQLWEVKQEILFGGQQQLVPCWDVQLPCSTPVFFRENHWRNVLMKRIQVRAMKKKLKKPKMILLKHIKYFVAYYYQLKSLLWIKEQILEGVALCANVSIQQCAGAVRHTCENKPSPVQHKAQQERLETCQSADIPGSTNPQVHWWDWQYFPSRRGHHPVLHPVVQHPPRAVLDTWVREKSKGRTTPPCDTTL